MSEIGRERYLIDPRDVSKIAYQLLLRVDSVWCQAASLGADVRKNLTSRQSRRNAQAPIMPPSFGRLPHHIAQPTEVINMNVTPFPLGDRYAPLARSRKAAIEVISHPSTSCAYHFGVVR